MFDKASCLEIRSSKTGGLRLYQSAIAAFAQQRRSIPEGGGPTRPPVAVSQTHSLTRSPVKSISTPPCAEQAVGEQLPGQQDGLSSVIQLPNTGENIRNQVTRSPNSRAARVLSCSAGPGPPAGPPRLAVPQRRWLQHLPSHPKARHSNPAGWGTAARNDFAKVAHRHGLRRAGSPGPARGAERHTGGWDLPADALAFLHHL